ncbi:MAG: hypothetical protein NC818_00180 [Candidatus Omnitrophica bacterium]|nr:hypothetical protein [Candidatus Omnitrophota bacterium]
MKKIIGGVIVATIILIPLNVLAVEVSNTQFGAMVQDSITETTIQGMRISGPQLRDLIVQPPAFLQAEINAIVGIFNAIDIEGLASSGKTVSEIVSENQAALEAIVRRLLIAHVLKTKGIANQAAKQEAELVVNGILRSEAGRAFLNQTITNLVD